MAKIKTRKVDNLYSEYDLYLAISRDHNIAKKVEAQLIIKAITEVDKYFGRKIQHKILEPFAGNSHLESDIRASSLISVSSYTTTDIKSDKEKTEILDLFNPATVLPDHTFSFLVYDSLNVAYYDMHPREALDLFFRKMYASMKFGGMFIDTEIDPASSLQALLGTDSENLSIQFDVVVGSKLWVKYKADPYKDSLVIDCTIDYTYNPLLSVLDEEFLFKVVLNGTLIDVVKVEKPLHRRTWLPNELMDAAYLAGFNVQGYISDNTTCMQPIDVDAYYEMSYNLVPTRLLLIKE